MQQKLKTPHPGRLLEACRRDDRNSDCHRGMLKAAIQEVFADR